MNENDLTDEELDQLEKDTAIVEDRFDRLELFRRKLFDSRLQQMYIIKRSSALGPLCPYYKKASRLFQDSEMKEIIAEMRTLLEEFKDV
jgi:hypothetical protein